MDNNYEGAEGTGTCCKATTEIERKLRNAILKIRNLSIAENTYMIDLQWFDKLVDNIGKSARVTAIAAMDADTRERSLRIEINRLNEDQRKLEQEVEYLRSNGTTINKRLGSIAKLVLKKQC